MKGNLQKLSAAIFAIILSYGITNAQCPITANAGDNQTICPGSGVEMNASGGTFYTWSPITGLSNPSIANPIASPTVNTVYTVTVSNASGELVTNGDFESGNTGFSADYIFVNTPYSGGYSSGTGLWPEGKYAVGTDPNFYHPLFFGSGYPSGTGNLMIVNGSVTPGQKVWGQTVAVVPFTDYYFSAEISTLVTTSPAELQFKINGSLIGPMLVAPGVTFEWDQFYAVWNSGPYSAAAISIVNGNTIASGNDFGLDNISFTTVCSSTDEVVVNISNLDALLIPTNINCGAINSGSIDLSVSSGEAPYSYLWSNGSTDEDPIGLIAGNYSVTVYDSHQCNIVKYATVSGAEGLTAEINKSDVTCFDACNGSAEVVADGGSGNYSYNWSNGTSGAGVIGLCAGDYSVTVLDAAGCSVVKSVTITQPSLLFIVMDCVCPYHTINCHGDCNGMANMTVYGGTQPYSYSWSNEATTQDIENLCAGFYCVTVTDANGCTREQCIMIEEPTEIEVGVHSADAALCSGENCDGSSSLNVAGGTPPYTIAWSNGATGSSAVGLCAGSYSVTVTDAHGCGKVVTVNVGCTIPPPPPPPSCPAPTNFHVTSVTSSSANLTWDEVVGAYAYKIRRRAVGTANWVNTGAYAPANHKLIQNLQCNTSYEWQIMTYCNSEKTDSSGWVSNTPNFTTAPNCAMPVGLYTDNITATSVIVHWTSVVNASSYRIRFKKHGTSAWTNVYAPGITTQKTILNLIPGLTYDWQLRAKCSGSGDVSAFSNSTIQHFTLLNGTKLEDESGDVTVPLNIYPNPTSGNITVELNNGCKCNDEATITVTNVLGQLIYTFVANLNIVSLKQEIELPSSAIDGIYFVTIRSKEYVETRRITVSK